MSTDNWEDLPNHPKGKKPGISVGAASAQKVGAAKILFVSEAFCMQSKPCVSQHGNFFLTIFFRGAGRIHMQAWF